MRKLIGLLVLFGWAGSVNAATMDFSGQSIGSAPTTYTEDGIRLVASAPAGSTLFNLGDPQPGYAFNTSSAVSAVFDLVNGGPFALASFDIETQFNLTASFVGSLSGGGTVMESFLVNTGPNIFATFIPTLDFSNIVSLTLSVPSGAGVTFIDNIILSPVPIPAAAWLFGSALLGLGMVKRRKA
jgi:hypothetical protein